MRFFNTAGPDEHYHVPALDQGRLDADEFRLLIRQRKFFALHAPRVDDRSAGADSLEEAVEVPVVHRFAAAPIMSSSGLRNRDPSCARGGLGFSSSRCMRQRGRTASTRPDRTHTSTSQRPPFVGPTRRTRPADRKRSRWCRTPPTERPTRSAKAGIVSWGRSRSNARMRSPLVSLPGLCRFCAGFSDGPRRRPGRVPS